MCVALPREIGLAHNNPYSTTLLSPPNFHINLLARSNTFQMKLILTGFTSLQLVCLQHDLFTSLLMLHTPFLNIVQITVIKKKHVIRNTHLIITYRDSSYQERLFETFMIRVAHDTSHSKLTLKMEHCCDNNTTGVSPYTFTVKLLW